MKREIVLFALVFLFSLSLVSAASDKLIRYWSLDSDFVDSVIGQTGTATGSIYFVPAKFDNGMFLNGSSSYLTYGNINFTSTNSSLNFWVNKTTLGDISFLSRTANYELYTQTGQLRFYLFDTVSNTVTLDYAAGDAQISIGRPVMVTVTVEVNSTAATWRLYINGTNVYNQSNAATAFMRDVDGSVWRSGTGGGRSGENLTIDAFGVWNRTINQSEITSLLTTQPIAYKVINLVSPANNSQTVSNPVFFNSSIFSTESIVNATLYVWNDIGVLFNQTTNLVSGTENSTTWNVFNFVADDYIWNVLWCDVTSCSYASANNTFFWGVVENSQTYSPIAISGTQESFAINISYDNILTSAILPYLIYNTTAYAPQQIYGSGNNKVFNATITIPSSNTVITQNFYWAFTFTNLTGSLSYFNSTKKTQITQPLGVDNCGTYTSQIMNFTLYDEDLRTPLNGTIELAMTFYDAGTYSIIGFFNTTYPYVTTGQPLRVCINSSQINSSIRMDYHAKYYTTEFVYAIENKFGQNLTISAIPSQISLYDLNDTQSTPFQITLQGANLDAISGALVDIQREYVPINQFISVETPLTDDLGTTIGHFVAENVYYNFIVTKNGQLLGTFNKQLAKCQNVVTGDCRIVLNLIESTQNPTDYSTYGNISVNYQWTPSTRTLVTNWLSADGASHAVIQNVSIFDNWGNTTACSSSASGLSGTFTCIVPTTYGNTTVISQLYSDGTYIGFSIFNLGDNANTIFGGAKVVLGILMYATLTLLMISNPIAMVFGAGLGMVFLTGFHVLDGGSIIGNSSIVLWFLIAGGILIWQIAKRT